MKQDLWVLRKLISYFPSRDRLVFLAAVGIQFVLSIIDVFALLITGVLAGLVITYSTGAALPNSLIKILHTFHLNSDQFVHPTRGTLAVLGALIVTALIGRTLASLFLQKKTLNILAHRQTYLAGNFGNLMTDAKYPWVRQAESGKLTYALTDGINDLALITISNVLTITGESILISLICLSFLAISIKLLILLVAFAAALSILMHTLGSKKAFNLGNLRAEAVVNARNIVKEEISLFRELKILNKTSVYDERYQAAMLQVATSSSKYLWLQQIPKFLLEISVVLVGVLLLVFSSSSSGLVATSQATAVFFLGLMRVGPSLLRFQGALAGFRNSIGGASIAFAQLEELKANSRSLGVFEGATPGRFAQEISPFSISISEVSFRYPEMTKNLIADFSLSIGRGEKLAIVGPSGGGKTTLCDLLLGLNEPNSGTVEIEGLSPSEYTSVHPGSIGLVPQSVIVIDATIAENVALGCALGSIDMDRVDEVCRIANLEDVIHEMGEGTLTRLGERGVQLSGGQKQRLGLARALYTDPVILILDEPTSALDSISEKKLLDAFNQATSDRTVIVVAHRLSTVKSMDRILYLNQTHSILAKDLEELRKLSPDFEHQASLLDF